MSIWNNLKDNPARIQQMLMGLGMLGSKTRSQFDRYMGGAFNAAGAVAARDKELEQKAMREKARQDFAGLLGERGTPRVIERGPDSDLGPAGTPGTPGTGFLGGEMGLGELAVKGMTIPGYEGISAGLLGKFLQTEAQRGAADRAAAKEERKMDLDRKKLLKDYQNQVKPYADQLTNLKGSFRAMISSASTKAGSEHGRGAADLAMVFNFAKMLDPTSVVREGEQQMIMRSDGVFGYLKGLANSLGPGKGNLDENTRKGLLAEAHRQLIAKSKPLIGHVSFLGQGFGDLAPLAISSEITGFQDWLDNLEMPTEFGAEEKPGNTALTDVQLNQDNKVVGKAEVGTDGTPLFHWERQ